MELNKKYNSVDEEASAEIVRDLCLWLRDFFTRRVNSRWIDERRCIPPYIVNEFAKKGIFGFHSSPEDGGLGLTTVDWIKLIGQLGGLDATISQLVAINGLGTRPYIAYGSKVQKENILHGLAKGHTLSCFAQTEDSAGTNFMAMESVAIKSSDNSSWTINGSKVWIGNAGWSNIITLVSQTKSEDGDDLGLTAFVVPTDTVGVIIGEELNTMGLRGVVQNRIDFKDVTIPVDAILGDVGDGLSVAVDAMSFTRLMISAQQIGLMKKAVQVMWKFANARTISTGLLADNAIGVNFVSECIGRIDTIEILLNTCAKHMDSGKSISPELSSICKVLSTEFAGYVTDTALQLLGGRGYEENNVIPQLVRDTRVTRIFEGPTEALCSFIGSRASNDSLIVNFSFLSDDKAYSQQLIDEIDDKVADYKADSFELPITDEQKIQWINYKKGLLVSWGALCSAYCTVDEPNEDIESWLESGGDRAPLFVNSPCFLSREYINSAIERYKSDIGDVIQISPALNSSLDEMLNTTI